MRNKLQFVQKSPWNKEINVYFFFINLIPRERLLQKKWTGQKLGYQ